MNDDSAPDVGQNDSIQNEVINDVESNSETEPTVEPEVKVEEELEPKVEAEPEPSAEGGSEEKPLFEKNPKDKKVFKWMGLGLLGVLLIVGAVLFLQWLFYDGGLAWNENYGDYKVEYASQVAIKLRAEAKDADVLKDAGIESSCDKSTDVALAEYDNGAIKWDLSDALGKCTVKIKYRLKTIEKTFVMVPSDIVASEKSEKLNLGDYDAINEDSDDDTDGDSLSNKEEKALKTNPRMSDTDGDGLEDGYEVNTSKTDPLKADTDADGLDDYNERVLGYDPLVADSKGDGVKDGQRKTKYSYKNKSGVKIEITGTGNIASVGAEIIKDAALSKKSGFIPNLYNFYTDGNLEEATITIPYTTEQLKQAGITEDELTLLYYDSEKDQYQTVDTTVDKKSKTIIAKLKHFSYYVVGVADGGGSRSDGEVLFVLDNSWSMYTNEQYKEITGKEWTGGLFSSGVLDGSDASGRRFSLTKQLASKISARGMKVGLAEFRGDFAMMNSIGSESSAISSSLDGMNGSFVTSTEGTNIGGAIRKGAEQFSDGANNKVIVLLTDGQDTVSLSSTANDIAKEMVGQNVKVCVVGFGEGAYNGKLSMITAMSGCKYSSSSDVNGLDEVFDIIEVQLNDELVDRDGDGTMDGLLVADSGFVVNRDGFSFDNYGSDLSEGGHCYGMALFAQLYYAGKMPLKSDSITSNGSGWAAHEGTSYAYNLSNSYFKSYKNLYDYKLQTEELKYVFGHDYFGLTEPASYYVLKGETLSFSDSIRSEIDKAGFYDIYTYPTTRTSEYQIEKYGFTYKDAEGVRFSEKKMQSSSTINNTDKNLFNAIYAAFIRQNTAKQYNSGDSFTQDLRDLLGSEDMLTVDGAGFVALLKGRLRAGEAPVIASNFSGGLHAINAISLTQDMDDHNHYYIGVYDNNYPGERREVEMRCGRKNCYTKANSYYSNSDEPIRITMSEADDLKYFEN